MGEEVSKIKGLGKGIWEKVLGKGFGKETGERNIFSNALSQIPFPDPFPRSLSLIFFIVGIVGILFVNTAFAQRSALDMTRAQAQGLCARCHKDIAQEWESSQHAKAWTNPVYQKAAAEVSDRKKACDPCHAPQPLLNSGAFSDMPKLRSDNQALGVDCLTCHLDKNGAMHGPLDDKSPFHDWTKDLATYTKSINICSSCHGQDTVPLHNQVAAYKESQVAKSGMVCQKCHMPEVERKMSIISLAATKGRKHTWPGGHNEQMLKAAATLNIEVADSKAKIGITNATGHNLPGTSLRTIIVDVTIKDASGKTTLNQKESYFQPQNSNETDNRIKPDETRTLTYETGTPNGKVEVKMLYKLHPDTPDSNLILMAEATKDF